MKPISLKCSGPLPGAKDLVKYRAAQRRALMILGELGFPICMGLTSDAEKLVDELQKQLSTMKRSTQ